jgi:hypothetical protein
MEAKDILNLQEAYLEVYQELDEVTRMRKELGKEGEIATRKELARRSKEYQHSATVDRTIAAAERGVERPYVKHKRDESEGDRTSRERKQSQTLRVLAASRRKSVRGEGGLRGYAAKVDGSDKDLQSVRGTARSAGTLTPAEKRKLGEEHLNEISADTALAASKEAGKRSGILAGLSAGDPKVKAKAVKKREQAERLYTASAKRRLKAKITPVKITREEYDFILSHLLDEGYTNTLEGAEVIASNMSDEWILSIVEAKVDKVKTKGMNRYVAAKLKSKMRNDRNLDPEQRASDTADTGFRRWHHSQKRGE